MFDALLKKEIFVQCPVLCITCDNPTVKHLRYVIILGVLHGISVGNVMYVLV